MASQQEVDYTSSDIGRSTLPLRRLSYTSMLRWNNNPWSISVGFFNDGRRAEVFVNGSKSGADMQAIARDGAVLISLALQYGCPLRVIQRAVTREQDGSPASLLGKVIDEMAAMP